MRLRARCPQACGADEGGDDQAAGADPLPEHQVGEDGGAAEVEDEQSRSSPARGSPVDDELQGDAEEEVGEGRPPTGERGVRESGTAGGATRRPLDGAKPGKSSVRTPAGLTSPGYCPTPLQCHTPVGIASMTEASGGQTHELALSTDSAEAPHR